PGPSERRGYARLPGRHDPRVRRRWPLLARGRLLGDPPGDPGDRGVRSRVQGARSRVCEEDDATPLRRRYGVDPGRRVVCGATAGTTAVTVGRLRPWLAGALSIG